MAKKGQRNQELQPSKAEKGYGGYLPSVQSKADAEGGERPADANPVQMAERPSRRK